MLKKTCSNISTIYIVDSSVHKKNKDNLNLHRLIITKKKTCMYRLQNCKLIIQSFENNMKCHFFGLVRKYTTTILEVKIPLNCNIFAE